MHKFKWKMRAVHNKNNSNDSSVKSSLKKIKIKIIILLGNTIGNTTGTGTGVILLVLLGNYWFLNKDQDFL